MSLKALRQQIQQVIEGVTPGEAHPVGLPTGIPALNAMLPSNGIPRGRLTELLGTQGAGRTTLLKRIVQTVINNGLWVAYIDASRTLAPESWAHIGRHNTLWVVRPPHGDAKRGAWCADILLRSGAFALVVLDGAPTLTRSIAVRLSRLAHDSNAAFIVTSDERSATMLGGAVRLRLKPLHPVRPTRRRTRDATVVYEAARKRFAICMEKGGNPKTVEVSCAIAVESRLCTYTAIPDRRGVARGTRGKWGSVAAATATSAPTTAATFSAAPGEQGNAGKSWHNHAAESAIVGSERRTLPRKRRFAEPEIHVGTFSNAALG
jgi:hypothetical protein